MSGYPGRKPRPWRSVIFAALLAYLVAFGVGWLVFHGSENSAAKSASPCPGAQHDKVSRDQASACLVARYFALVDAPAVEQNAQLAQLIVPNDLDSARAEYQPLDARVATEYAAVAAIKLIASDVRPDTDYSGNAWVAFVDSYKDDSPPRSQWWITSFDLHWQDGRWWLAGSGVGLRVDATPPATGPATGGFGYGPGWVAVGHG